MALRPRAGAEFSSLRFRPFRHLINPPSISGPMAVRPQSLIESGPPRQPERLAISLCRGVFLCETTPRSYGVLTGSASPTRGYLQGMTTPRAAASQAREVILGSLSFAAGASPSLLLPLADLRAPCFVGRSVFVMPGDGCLDFLTSRFRLGPLCAGPMIRRGCFRHGPYFVAG